MTFGERLADARALRQVTQEALAQRAQVNQTLLSHFETGTRLPAYKNLLKLADALEVSVDYLMGRTDDPGLYGSADPLLQDLVRLSARDRRLATAFVQLLRTIEMPHAGTNGVPRQHTVAQAMREAKP